MPKSLEYVCCCPESFFLGICHLLYLNIYSKLLHVCHSSPFNCDNGPLPGRCKVRSMYPKISNASSFWTLGGFEIIKTVISRFCISSFANYILYHCKVSFDVWIYVIYFFRPACILRVTWMTVSFCSAASTRSHALLGSSATPPSSSPTLSSNHKGAHVINHHTVVLIHAAAVAS